jgi:outer membrane receptor protein involved in Fe transport
MTVLAALDRLLADTAFRARRVGPSTYLVVARDVPATPAPDHEAPIDDIIVTGTKIPERLSRIAAPISVYHTSDPDEAVARGTRDVSARVEGLSTSNLGPGRNRSFLRGIADSGFNGFSQSTVSVQVDEARITYDAPDPDLRLIDVERVEILKGPQGPLYGTGALGGVYHIVTVPAALDQAGGRIQSDLSSLAHGGIGGGGDAMLNLPLIRERLALRLVAYTEIDQGYIANAFGDLRSNRSMLGGGRAALRAVPIPGWTLDLLARGQQIRTRDSQYVDRDAETLTRTTAIPEPHFGTSQGLAATLTGPIGGSRLTLASSYAWQSAHDRFDASASADALGIVRALAFDDVRRYHVFDQQVRVTGGRPDALTWTAGLSYLAADTDAIGTVTDRSGQAFDVTSLRRRVTETAVFAEGSASLPFRLRAGLGIRVFRTTDEDGRQESGIAAHEVDAVVGATPSASLAWQASQTTLVYARFASALRPGGIDLQNLGTGRYDADEVRSFDLGARLQRANGRIKLDANLFFARWLNVQSDYLLPSGLIGTHNAGDASIPGAEVTMSLRAGSGWRVDLGANLQRARLIHATDGVDLPADRRLPIVPDVTFRLTIAKTLNQNGWRLTPHLGGRYVGLSRLSFDDGLDRRTPGYAIFEVGFAIQRGRLSTTLMAENIFDAQADSFAFGNPFSIRTTPQFTPVRPRKIGLSVARKF